jgi:hypothetical protein
LLDKVELKALVVYSLPIYRSLVHGTVGGSSHRARGKGTSPRPDTEAQYVIDKWVIA